MSINVQQPQSYNIVGATIQRGWQRLRSQLHLSSHRGSRRGYRLFHGR